MMKFRRPQNPFLIISSLIISLFFFDAIWSCSSESESSQEIIDFYDNEALSYDEGYSTSLCKAENKILFDLIEPTVINKKVLDVGCGTGFLLDYYEIEDYLGIDISPTMIQLAEKKHPNSCFIVGEMESLVKTIESNSFDCIVSLFGPISYCSQPVDLLNEFYRILAPGGTLVVMPYTKRLEHRFLIGGYNTATQDDVKRTYYSTQMVQAVMSDTNFNEVEIRGMNYFGSLVEAMGSLYGQEHDEEFYYQLLKNEQNLKGITLPIEYARHALIIAKKQTTEKSS